MNENDYTPEELVTLSPEDFKNVIKRRLMPNERFQAFLHERVIDRTHEWLMDAADSVAARIIVLRREGLEDSLQKAEGFERLVKSRIRTVEIRKGVKNGHNIAMKQLRAFAHELCAALSDSDNADALDTIKFPWDDLTAEEWFLQAPREAWAPEGRGGGVIPRRTVLAAAWSAPVIALAMTAPSATASDTPPARCGLHHGPGSNNGTYDVYPDKIVVNYREVPDIYEANVKFEDGRAGMSFGTNFGSAPPAGSLIWIIPIPALAGKGTQIHGFADHYGEVC